MRVMAPPRNVSDSPNSSGIIDQPCTANRSARVPTTCIAHANATSASPRASGFTASARSLSQRSHTSAIEVHGTSGPCE